MSIKVYLEGRRVSARGVYRSDTNKVTLKRGSILAIDPSAPCPRNIAQNYETARSLLGAKKLKRRKDGRLTVAKDIPGLSPSAAYVIATGKPGSGPKGWKTADGRTIEEIRAVEEGAPPNGPEDPRQNLDGDDAGRRGEILSEVVRRIHNSEWQRHYRNGAIGDPVIGWTNRLKKYALASQQEPSLFEHLQWLKSQEGRARAFIPANPAHEVTGQELGAEILVWGGVERGNLDRLPTVIGPVCETARTGQRVDNAPMNSGWTKIAAVFSYYHDGAPPQVIWDSRVSLSVCRRIAEVAADMNINQETIQRLFPDLGWIPGRGGRERRLGYQRTAAHYFRKRYGHWDAHFAGGAVVAEMARILNENANLYGFPAQALTAEENAAANPHNCAWFEDWTPWLVACVLFMDGE